MLETFYIFLIQVHYPWILIMFLKWKSLYSLFYTLILLIKRNGFTESKQSQYLRATSAAIMNIIKSLESLLKQLSSALLQLFFPSSKKGNIEYYLHNCGGVVGGLYIILNINQLFKTKCGN